MRRFGLCAALLAAALLAPAAAGGAPAPLPNPDRPARIPFTGGGKAGASISASGFCNYAKGQVGAGNGASGLLVMDAGSGATLCSKGAQRTRILASNTKLFTTSAALEELGAGQRLPTRLFSVGEVDRDGTLHGSLFLKGGGDPTLGTGAFDSAYMGGAGTTVTDLVRPLKRAGIRKVTGRLFADDTIFDRRRGVADSGYRTSPWIGPLSGLSFNAGYTDTSFSAFSGDPARLAANKLVRAMRNQGISIQRTVARRKTPGAASRELVGVLRSPDMAKLVRYTNVDSNNFFAEMLLKNLGARAGDGGTTAAGSEVVEAFARAHGSGIQSVDGSGLTRTNRATPAQVARLLAYMRTTDDAKTFIDSLPTAGVDGTLASRMRGSAAQGRCHAKTGTLTGVTALSGYCLNRSGRTIIFSILMNQVTDVYAARAAQDRITAAAARL